MSNIRFKISIPAENLSENLLTKAKKTIDKMIHPGKIHYNEVEIRGAIDKFVGEIDPKSFNKEDLNKRINQFNNAQADQSYHIHLENSTNLSNNTVHLKMGNSLINSVLSYEIEGPGSKKLYEKTSSYNPRFILAATSALLSSLVSAAPSLDISLLNKLPGYMGSLWDKIPSFPTAFFDKHFPKAIVSLMNKISSYISPLVTKTNFYRANYLFFIASVIWLALPKNTLKSEATKEISLEDAIQKDNSEVEIQSVNANLPI